MKKKLAFTFMFHVFCLGLLVVPNEFQGPVVLAASGSQLRVLDLTAISLIVLGSLLLNVFIFQHYWPQVKKVRQILKEVKNS